MIKYWGCNIAREIFLFKIVNEYVINLSCIVLEILIWRIICSLFEIDLLLSFVAYLREFYQEIG